MEGSFISYLPLGFPGLVQAATSSPDLKGRVDNILNTEYRKIKQLIENNKEAVSAIAEALILRNELTDIDVNEILARVEAQHPFVDPHKPEERPFGLLATRTQPEAAIVRRNGRVSILGFPGRAQPQPNFNPLDPSWFYAKQLTLLGAGFAPRTDCPPAELRFNLRRNLEYILDLMASEALCLDSLITLRLPAARMKEAYELASQHSKEMIGTVFQWS